MRPDHPLLTTPQKVPHTNGGLVVLKRRGEGQENQGEALTLDSIVGSCDAEVVAKGLSAKGPERGAIVRHGPYTLWGYAGGVREMTDDGRALFVNTVHWAARQGDQVVLERRRNMTRDGLWSYLEKPGLVDTMRQYLPQSLGRASAMEIELWLRSNRPYLRCDGRRFAVDELARKWKTPNHTQAFLRRCLDALDGEDSPAAARALARYTGRDAESTPADWRRWHEENEAYLYFADCDGSRFLVDEEAKRREIPFAELRGWSSEELDYRTGKQ